MMNKEEIKVADNEFIYNYDMNEVMAIANLQNFDKINKLCKDEFGIVNILYSNTNRIFFYSTNITEFDTFQDKIDKCVSYLLTMHKYSSINNRDEVWIYNVCTDPMERGKKYMKKIMEYLINWYIKKNPMLSINLSIELTHKKEYYNHLVNFYKKLGFKQPEFCMDENTPSLKLTYTSKPFTNKEEIEFNDIVDKTWLIFNNIKKIKKCVKYLRLKGYQITIKRPLNLIFQKPKMTDYE